MIFRIFAQSSSKQLQTLASAPSESSPIISSFSGLHCSTGPSSFFNQSCTSTPAFSVRVYQLHARTEQGRILLTSPGDSLSNGDSLLFYSWTRSFSPGPSGPLKLLSLGTPLALLCLLGKILHCQTSAGQRATAAAAGTGPEAGPPAAGRKIFSAPGACAAGD